ncbi:MAG TPA: hypothetical protein VFB79_09195 [Candidatus Angelobacter sp.]|nr:hypothetical protein [Candidatus Angelobacter sp.]
MLGALQLRQEILELCNPAIHNNFSEGQAAGKSALEQTRQTVPEARNDVFDEGHALKVDYELKFFDWSSMERRAGFRE